MQLSLPLLPNLDGKKTERITIAVTVSQKQFLQAILGAYKDKGKTLSESEFVYLAFIKGLQAAVGSLSLPDHYTQKIF